jgi:Cu2+-exporting ATPase
LAVRRRNRQFMEQEHVAIATVEADVKSLRREGQTVMFVAIDGRLAGFIGVADRSRRRALKRWRRCRRTV